MANAVKGDKAATEKPGTEFKQSYYWAGTLPRPGTFDYKVHSDKYNRQLEEFSEFRNETAESLWNGGTRIWQGKCSREQNIGVPGHEFVAWSDRVERQGDTPDFNITPYPGAVLRLTEDEAKRIVSQCYRVIYRNRPGVEGGVKSLDAHKHPEIDPNNPLTRPYATEFVTFNPRTDTYVAEYVYLVKVKDVDDSNWDIKDNQLWRLNPCQTMEDFFRNPPKSVSEMYPQKPEGNA